MSKKLIIGLSVGLGVVGIILVLCWTLFALSSVTVEFHSTTYNLTLTQEEIVEAGRFNYGSCVFFGGKKQAEKNIENACKENENFAYVRVLNIETVFPNKYVIHIAEREELFAISHNGQTLICDRDFRVLDIETAIYESKQNNAIIMQGLDILNQEIAVGDFLDVKQKSMTKFYSAMLQNNRDYAQQIGKFKEMKLTPYQDKMTKKEYFSLELTTFQGRKFVVNNPDFAFANKVQLMFAVESALYNQNVDKNGNVLNKNGDKIYLKEIDGEYQPAQETDDGAVALTLDLLEEIAIKVDNLTLDPNVKRTENDIYYCLAKK